MGFLNLSKITNIFFRRKISSPDKNQSETCFVAKDADTNLDQIVYLKGNKTFFLDLNAVVTMHWMKSGKPCVALLEPEDAEMVKKSIVRYFETRKEPLPELFGFLKVFLEQKESKSLFGLKS